MKAALHKGTLKKDDLHEFGDAVLWKRLQEVAKDVPDMRVLLSPELKLEKVCSVLNGRPDIHPDALAVYSSTTKVRFIDPPLLTRDKQIVSLSQVDRSVAESLRQHKYSGLQQCWIEVRDSPANGVM